MARRLTCTCRSASPHRTNRQGRRRTHARALLRRSGNQRMEDAGVLVVERRRVDAAVVQMEGADGGGGIVQLITEQAQRQHRVEAGWRRYAVRGGPAAE